MVWNSIRPERLRPWLALLLLAGLGGCAKRTDAQTRAAFENSSAPGSATPGKPGTPGDEPAAPSSDGEVTVKRGWARVDELVLASTRVLETSPTPDTIAHLAHVWCLVEPEPKDTDHGEVRVCFPQPPVTVDGHSFSLELASLGVIGLVASELSERDSRALEEKALSRIRSLCAEDFENSAPARTTVHDVHTCRTDQGSLLAVGRIPVSRGVWQVSIAIISAT